MPSVSSQRHGLDLFPPAPSPPPPPQPLPPCGARDSSLAWLPPRPEGRPPLPAPQHRGPPPLVSHHMSSPGSLPSAAPRSPASYQQPIWPTGPSPSYSQLSQLEETVVRSSQRERLLELELEHTKRKLAEKEAVQQQQQQQDQHYPSHHPASSSSSSAPPPPADCAICMDAPATIKIMPCREMKICPQCFDLEKARWQAEVARVRAKRTRLREEGEPPDPKLADDPKFLCPFCRKEIAFAGTEREAAKWSLRNVTD